MSKTPTTVRFDDDDLAAITAAARAEGLSAAQWIGRRAADEAQRLRIARWRAEHPQPPDDPQLRRWDEYQEQMMATVLREDEADAA